MPLRGILFLLIGLIISVFLLVYLSACPSVTELTATPDSICYKSKTVISFTADWAEEDCLPWDQSHTIRWKYKKDDGAWSAPQTIQLRPEGGEDTGTSADGSFEIYGSSEASGYEEGDPCLDGFGSYTLKVEAKGEKDGNTGWGEIGTTTVTIYSVDSIDVTPKGTPEDYSLPNPVKIAAGAIESDAHQADVTIKVKPQKEGVTVRVCLLNGRGHESGKDAKLVIGSNTAIGDGGGIEVQTNSDGEIIGVLTSSDVINDCIVHCCDKDCVVKFTWDEFSDKENYEDLNQDGEYTPGEPFTDTDGDGCWTNSEWISDPPYLITPGTSTETLRLRHHRGTSNDENWKPLDGHQIRFFVEEVIYEDENGEPITLTNSATNPSDLSEWAHFPIQPVTTNGDGTVTITLTVEDKPEMISLTMVAYDFSVWDEPAPIGNLTMFAAQAEEDSRIDHEEATKDSKENKASLMIAFTFDDGPHETLSGKTVAIINTLKTKETALKKPVKATFFVEHTRIDSGTGKTILKDHMTANGHEIGVHGADPEIHHRKHQDTPNLQNKIINMKSIISSGAAGGQTAKHVRPPKGWGGWTSGTVYTKAQVSQIYANTNLTRYTGEGTGGVNSWGLVYPSSANTPPSTAEREAFIKTITNLIDVASTEKTTKKLVILMHDVRTPDKNDIGPIIDEIEEYANGKSVQIAYRTLNNFK